MPAFNVGNKLLLLQEMPPLIVLLKTIYLTILRRKETLRKRNKSIRRIFLLMILQMSMRSFMVKKHPKRKQRSRKELQEVEAESLEEAQI